jgi:hypothetical protein
MSYYHLAKNHNQATTMLIFIEVFFLILVFSLRGYGDIVVLPLVMGMAVFFVILLNVFYKKQKKKEAANQKSGKTSNQVFINKTA